MFRRKRRRTRVKFHQRTMLERSAKIETELILSKMKTVLKKKRIKMLKLSD